MFKKFFLSFLLISSFMIFTSDESMSLTDIVCTDEWYELELGAKKGEANPVHLAVTLSECDPEDTETIDQIIAFWISRGGDVNATFNYVDFLEFMYNDVNAELLPKSYKNHAEITLLMLFSSVGGFVDCLIKAGARCNLDTLAFWIEQYQDFEEMFPRSSTPECLYQFQYEGLQAMFNALGQADKMKFVIRHASFARYLKN